jgi:hypothetical protein
MVYRFFLQLFIIVSKQKYATIYCGIYYHDLLNLKGIH